MNDSQHHDRHSNFGFLSGMLVGGSIMLMLGTKKGRKLVDHILTEGEENWGKFLEENPKLEKKLEEKTAKIVGKVVKTKEIIDAKKEISTGLRAFGKKTASRFFHKKGKPLT